MSNVELPWNELNNQEQIEFRQQAAYLLKRGYIKDTDDVDAVAQKLYINFLTRRKE